MVVTALVLGFAGSLHCLGMCSPLALAITHTRKGAVWNKLIYNGGRVLMYGILGAVVSSFGLVIRFSAFQAVLSVSLGVLLVFMGLAGMSSLHVPVITPLMQKLSLTLKDAFARVLKHKTRRALFLLGTLNGLLPCGLTYLALTYCLVLKGPLDGFNFMLVFGAGTLPVMAGFTVVLQYLIRRFAINTIRLTRISLVISGCLLIGRVVFAHHDQSMASPGSEAVVICK